MLHICMYFCANSNYTVTFSLYVEVIISKTFPVSVSAGVAPPRGSESALRSLRSPLSLSLARHPPYLPTADI